MDLLHNDLIQMGVLAFACLLLHAYGFLGSTYSAKEWALRDDRHRIFKGAAYLGALPLRILFSLFSGLVATIVWAVVLGGLYLLVRAVRGV
jgi:hypothetical protein